MTKKRFAQSYISVPPPYNSMRNWGRKGSGLRHFCQAGARRYSSKYLTDKEGAKCISCLGRPLQRAPTAPSKMYVNAEKEGPKSCSGPKFPSTRSCCPKIELTINLLLKLLFIFYCLSVYFKLGNLSSKVLLHK